jgi:PAS domain S-box-containing protein
MPVIAQFLSLMPQLRRRRRPAVFKERERIEQDIRDRNRLIDGILKSTPASIYIFDCDQGRNELVSARAQTLLGYADAEWQERSTAFLELMHPDDRSRVPAHFDHIRSAPDGTVLQFEYRVRHADGGWRWFLSCDSSYERGADGSLRKILGTAFDIRIANESKMHPSKARRDIAQFLKMRPWVSRF